MRTDADSLGFLIADVARLLRRRFERALDKAGLGLTPGEARTLAHAGRHGQVRQSALAESMCVEPMTLVGYLDRLEAAGLVKRLPDPDDRRAKLVSLTPRARPVLDRIAAVGRAVRESATGGLDAGDVEVLRNALLRMRAELAGEEPQDTAGEAA